MLHGQIYLRMCQCMFAITTFVHKKIDVCCYTTNVLINSNFELTIKRKEDIQKTAEIKKCVGK